MPSDRQWGIVFAIYGLSVFAICVVIWELLKHGVLFLIHHLSFTW